MKTKKFTKQEENLIKKINFFIKENGYNLYDYHIATGYDILNLDKKKRILIIDIEKIKKVKK
ncbi:MAG: hypothetical protein Q7R52_02700 [archaeon]|nr:hypothetical protein [archaeon]